MEQLIQDQTSRLRLAGPDREAALLERRLRRWIIAAGLLGVALPYLARLPLIHGGDGRLLKQYLDLGIPGNALLQACHAIAVGPLLLLMLLFRRRLLWLLPALAGYGFLARWHARLDLASDAQAAISLIWIPVFALPWIAGGAALAASARFAMRRFRA